MKLEAVLSGTGPPGALKVCVLNDEGYDPFDPSYFLTDYTWEMYNLNRKISVPVVQQLVKRDFDVFLNLCDSSWVNPASGPEVVKALEQAEVAFTGADSAFYEPSREDVKRVCRRHGIRTPEGVEACFQADIARAAGSLRFPLIVKPINSYGSVGIERESRVETPDALFAQAQCVIDEYHRVLIEEFIEGDEFTVLVVENPDDPNGPFTYPPIQYIFPPGESFKHYEMKWVLFDQMRTVPCQDAALERRLMETGGKVFSGLNGVGYGRCDMRVNAAGEIFVLEINPNCGIFFPVEEAGGADLAVLNDSQGHRGFLRRIFRAALARQSRLRPAWVVRYTPERGYALHARRAVAAGQVILQFEQRPHTLVSQEVVLQNRPPEQQRLFWRHAFPLADELWVAPGDDPAGWTPFNHSCDPNAWWGGLDVVARRDIAEGEEITLDYATFHNELMPEFACGCLSSGCRKIVRGTDYLQPFVERYEGHVTDFVRKKRFAQQLWPVNNEA